jgi:hypothetical protein
MRARGRSSVSGNRSPQRRSRPSTRRTIHGSCLQPPESIPTMQPHSRRLAIFRNFASCLVVRPWRSASADSIITMTIHRAKPSAPRSRLRLRLPARLASPSSSTPEMRKTTPVLSFATLELPASSESFTATRAPIRWRSSRWARDGTSPSAGSSPSTNGLTTTWCAWYRGIVCSWSRILPISRRFPSGGNGTSRHGSRTRSRRLQRFGATNLSSLDGRPRRTPNVFSVWPSTLSSV